jgi:C1A family cysteine protease
MKSAAGIAAVAAIAGVAVYSQDASTQLFASTDSVEQEYLQYISKHGKSYGTKEEYTFRLEQFRKNFAIVEKHNSENADDAVLALNHMADWTSDEYKQLLGFKKNKKHHKHHKGAHKRHHRKLEANDLPASVDWVKAGAVTPVKNQGQCGSCWSFSATGSMEGRYQIKNKNLVSFSEQQLVDCSTKQGNMGCNGGLMDYAFTYAETTALDTEAQYPYHGRQGTCNVPSAGTGKVVSYNDVTPKSPTELASAVAEGPVSVAIDASGIFFQLYHGGIMKRFCGTSLDHGVLVVGYGTDNGTDYWLLKNSWGSGWGEKGYFRILRTMDKEAPGVCGLQLQPSYPLF